VVIIDGRMVDNGYVFLSLKHIVVNAKTQIQEELTPKRCNWKELKLLVVETKELWVRRTAVNSPVQMQVQEETSNRTFILELPCHRE
jgi:hypothetical protein